VRFVHPRWRVDPRARRRLGAPFPRLADALRREAGGGGAAVVLLGGAQSK
jgi:hypothetical protein